VSIIPPKPPAKVAKTRSIRIDKAILERIHEIALERDESDNYVIEKLLEYALQQYDAPKKTK
jgi:predicted transcriptional regulator